MQRFFTYGRKRRKVQDVSDVRLPVGAEPMDVERETVIVITIFVKKMPALVGAGIIYRDIVMNNVKILNPNAVIAKHMILIPVMRKSRRTWVYAITSKDPLPRSKEHHKM